MARFGIWLKVKVPISCRTRRTGSRKPIEVLRVSRIRAYQPLCLRDSAKQPAEANKENRDQNLFHPSGFQKKYDDRLFTAAFGVSCDELPEAPKRSCLSSAIPFYFNRSIFLTELAAAVEAR